MARYEADHPRPTRGRGRRRRIVTAAIGLLLVGLALVAAGMMLGM